MHIAEAVVQWFRVPDTPIPGPMTPGFEYPMPPAGPGNPVTPDIVLAETTSDFGATTVEIEQTTYFWWWFVWALLSSGPVVVCLVGIF